MTEEQGHSAAGPMAGMMYQVYYFLKQLLLLQPGESASLELYDDVALASGETIKYVQLKHTVVGNKRMTKRDHDLWKTLAMWVKIIQSKGGDEEQKQWLLGSEYVLLTNKDTEDNEFVALLKDFKRNGTDENAWKKLCDFIDKQATKNTSNEDGKTNEVDNFAKALAEFKYKREFLQRVVIEEQSDDEIHHSIINILVNNKYIDERNAQPLMKALYGELICSFKDTIQKNVECAFSDESFKDRFGNYFHAYAKRRFVPPMYSVPIVGNPHNFTFVKQLLDINDNKATNESRILMLVREMLNFDEAYRSAVKSITRDEQIQFEYNVHSKWDDIFLNIHQESNGECDEEKTARKVLYETRNIKLEFVEGESIDKFSNGCYYYFSDGEHPTIGWRKDWKEKYNGKDWTEIYGY